MPCAGGHFFSVTVTGGETSVVCHEEQVPRTAADSATGYRVLRVEGPLDLSMIGVLSSLTGALADHRIPVFTISTFDTDYLLLRDSHLGPAISALRMAGHRVSGFESPTGGCGR
jgi:uncharacterized protein